MPVIGYTKEVYDMKFRDGLPLFNQTIRPAGKRIYRVGQTLYHYTGPYRPGERVKIGTSVISEVVPITFAIYSCYVSIWNGNNRIDAQKLARDDGFTDVNGLITFFITTYGLRPGDSKEFVVIKWREFKKTD